MIHLLAVGTYVQTHVLGVALAIVASVAVGFFWHSVLFKNAWIRLSNLQNVPEKEMMATMIPGLSASILMAFVQAAVLGRAFELLLLQNVSHALIIATIIWIPFTGLAMLNNYVWSRRPFALFLIDGGYTLASTLAIAAVLYVTL